MDNSEFGCEWYKIIFNGKKVFSEIVDYFVLGGYLSTFDDMKIIEDSLDKIKIKFGIPIELPIKWNCKDLQGFYKSKGRLDVYKNIIDNSDEIRLSLIDVLKKTNCKLIIAAKPVFSKDRRKDVYNWAFINVLQRLGNVAKHELKNDVYPKISIIMDWPDGGNRSFFDIYSDAYYAGQQFYCGELKGLDLNINLASSVTLNSPHLQLADILVGSTKDFIKWCYEDKNEDRVKIFFPSVLPFFRKSEYNKIMGFGLIIGNKDNYNKFEKKIEDIQKLEETEVPF